MIWGSRQAATRTIVGWLAIPVAAALLSVGCQKERRLEDGRMTGIDTIQDLDEASVFNFTIMSDNKGDSPSSSHQFANMVRWTEQSNAQFVIGLGDHLKRSWENSFVPFLHENPWWRERFYPNVADGENEYYGESQADWGAGAPILDEVGLSARPHVSIRENECEYYARIAVKGYTIHLVQLHYSDQPPQTEVAFTEDSKQYLAQLLRSIQKGPKDIVIAAAHSRTGFWIDELSDDQRELVMNTCDMVLSATAHFWERRVVSGHENRGPLVLNTGSITYPARYCPPGFVQVHVLENPPCLVVQYVNADRPHREMQHSEYAFIKLLDGTILKTDFRKPRPEEDMDRVVGSLPRHFSQEEMNQVVVRLYLDATSADDAYATSGSSLERGNVTYRELWDVFPYNNEIYCLTLTAEEIQSAFDDELSTGGREQLRLAINSYYGDYLIQQLDLPDDRVAKSGKQEMAVLQEWLQTVE